MPVVLFQQTTDKYTDTQVEANEQLRSVSFAISAPYSALYQIAKKASSSGIPVWDGTEIPAQPGQGGFEDKIYGIRFKSFDSSHPTTILCKAFFEDDPVPTGDLASTSSFTTNGIVVPGTSITRVLTLPATPTDLTQVLLDLNATFPGVEWLCTFNAATGYWDVIGNPLPITGSISANTGGWHELAGIVVPNAGDYEVSFSGGSFDYPGGIAGGTPISSGVSIAGAVPAGANQFLCQTGPGTTTWNVLGAGICTLTGFTAGQRASLMVNPVVAGTNYNFFAYGYIQPIRIK